MIIRRLPQADFHLLTSAGFAAQARVAARHAKAAKAANFDTLALYRAVGEYALQLCHGDSVFRRTVRWHHDSPVDDKEIGIRGGQSLSVGVDDSLQNQGDGDDKHHCPGHPGGLLPNIHAILT